MLTVTVVTELFKQKDQENMHRMVSSVYDTFEHAVKFVERVYDKPLSKNVETSKISGLQSADYYLTTDDCDILIIEVREMEVRIDIG